MPQGVISVLAKILIVASLGSSLIRFRGDLINEWLIMGHSVVAAAPGREVEGALNEMGVGYYSISLKRTGLNPLEDLLLLGKLLLLLKKTKPDYLFLYTIKPVIYASLAAKLLPSVKVISLITGLGYAFTGSEGNSRLKVLVKKLYKLALKRNSRVLFQNPDDQEEFVSLGLVDSSKTVVVSGSGTLNTIKRFRYRVHR